MMRRRLGLIVLGLGVPLATTTHCGGSGSDDRKTNGSGGTAATTGGQVVVPLGGSAGESSGSGTTLNPLCGEFIEHDCIPDDPLEGDSCRGVELPTTSGGGMGGTGGSGATAGSGGSSSTGGNGGSGSTGGGFGQGGEGGEAGMAGEAGATGAEAGAPGAGGIPIDDGPDVSIPDPDALEPGVACQVRSSDDGPVRVCARAGAGQSDAPCTSAADCAETFACVVEGEAGICRPYCCRGAERSCRTGRHCAERTLLGSDVVVPVCVRADDCSLSQPYPCPEGEDCQCSEGTACLVVRGDGTTTCLAPGAGEAGEPCPCAWGHVCSQASGTCLKLCETVADGGQCEGGVCQAAAMLPGSWGVCISTESGP